MKALYFIATLSVCAQGHGYMFSLCIVPARSALYLTYPDCDRERQKWFPDDEHYQCVKVESVLK